MKRTTNLKTKNNQNCQKIKLYGSLTTKELKKKHPDRQEGRRQAVGQRGLVVSGSWQSGGPTFTCR